MAQTQLHYEILMELGGTSLRDVNYCAFIRSPIVKQASFCMIEIFMPQIMAKQLQSDLARNRFADVTLTIYSDDEASKDKMQNIYTKTLRCLDIKTDRTIRFEEDKIHSTLLLVHPILYYLSNNNTFNQIFLNQKPYDILGSYEDFLTNQFGDIFKFNHIGSDVNKNNFKYRQLLTRAPNDLSIPDYLIQNYKINNSFCYYFFDMFHVAEDSSNEICCNYVNLFDRNEFRQVDCAEYFDKQLTVNHIKTRNLSDPKNKLIDKKGHRIILKDPNIRAEYEKMPKQTSLDKKMKPTENEFELTENRKIKSLIEKNMVSHQYSGSSATSTLYCPDNIGNGQTRFNNALELIKDKIFQIEIYEMSNCLPDFPQFNEIYNLEDFNETNFNYVPISIINVFNRKNFREHYLYHLAKTALLRYKNQSE